MLTLPSAVRELLDGPNPAVVVTADAAGTPQASVVWIAREGDDVAFFCSQGTVKERNLRRRPDVVVIVVDPVREFEPGGRCYVRITGIAEIATMPDTSFIDGLAVTYMGLDQFPHEGNYLKVTVASKRLGGEGPTIGAANHGWGD